MIIDCVSNRPLPCDLYSAPSLQILTNIVYQRRYHFSDPLIMMVFGIIASCVSLELSLACTVFALLQLGNICVPLLLLLLLLSPNTAWAYYSRLFLAMGFAHVGDTKS